MSTILFAHDKKNLDKAVAKKSDQRIAYLSIALLFKSAGIFSMA